MHKSITTKVGDRGTTKLFSGETVSKNAPQTNAYGDVDELCSLLGLARVAAEGETADRLLKIQRVLFDACAELATSPEQRHLLQTVITAEHVAVLDSWREDLEQRITMPQDFVMPGSCEAAARLDVGRTVARRSERRIVEMMDAALLDNRQLLIWFNRLSDLLWLMARHVEGDQTVEKRTVPVS